MLDLVPVELLEAALKKRTTYRKPKPMTEERKSIERHKLLLIGSGRFYKN